MECDAKGNVMSQAKLSLLAFFICLGFLGPGGGVLCWGGVITKAEIRMLFIAHMYCSLFRLSFSLDRI